MAIRTTLCTLLALALAQAPSSIAQSVASAAVISFRVEGSGAAALATSSVATATTSAAAQALTISMNVASSPSNLTAAASTQAVAPPSTTVAASSSLPQLVSSAITSASSVAASATGAVPSTGSQNVWVMKVGSANGSLTFSPESISGAKPGDMVQFQFYPRNHSVALGDYSNACAPAANATNEFFSGFMPTSAEGQLTYTVAVKDTSPMWVYCTQGSHCQDGMVGVINPPASGQTLADYKARAAKAASNITPQSPSSPGAGAGAGSSPSMSTSASGAGGGAASSTITTGSPVATGATPSGPTSSPATASTSEASIILRKSSWGLAILATIVSLAL